MVLGERNKIIKKLKISHGITNGRDKERRETLRNEENKMTSNFLRKC